MDLLEKYIIARWCYAIGEDYIDDIEYRCIDEKLKEEMPDNEYVKRSWSDDPCPIELLEKYGLTQYYRDIKFAYKSESIRSINTVSDVESQLRWLSEKSRLSYKLDGFNIQVNYYNGKPISAETRGRTGNSLNANTVMKIVPQEIPVLGKVKVTGECVIPNKKWTLFQQDFNNVSQRNSVSTCLANGLTEYLAFVAFNIQSEDAVLGDHYTLLKEFGFNTPMYVEVSNYEELKRGIELMGTRRKFYAYPTDGLVLENTRCQVALRVGEWQESVMKSYVTGYIENIGMHSIPMLVAVAPVVSQEGKTHREVSVTNLQYIIDNKLVVGSPIAFDLRSMAAPVLNTFVTAELQQQYEGRYEEFQQLVDGK